MKFKSWNEYREKSQLLNLYTKAHLKELHLKPIKSAAVEHHQVYTGGRWKVFDFFKLEDTEEIKTKQPITIRELEINAENLCQSLYIINKSAKKSRDTKTKNYSERNYGLVSRSKNRQIDLYKLKNNALTKMYNENMLALEGYHIQHLQEGEVVLLLYRYNEYSFHMIGDKEDIAGLNFLGEINELISSEVTKKVDIKFNEAINLLENYIKI